MEKIIITGKRLEHLKDGQTPIVKLTPKAYNALIDIANESTLPLNRIASDIIEQAIDKDLVALQRPGDPDGGQE